MHTCRDRQTDRQILILHWCCFLGVIMGVTFVLLFPFGAALIRLLNNRVPNALALHRGVQIFNVVLVFIGMIMGVWRSNITGTVGLPTSLIYIITPRCSRTSNHP